MFKSLLAWIFAFLVILNILSADCGAQAQTLIADHQAVSAFQNIPTSYFSQVRSVLNVFYGHTSHGGQIVTGLWMLEAEDDAINPGLYDLPYLFEEDWIDLGDEEWLSNTRSYLNDHPETNLVIWSWCGQLSDYGAAQVDDYLTEMNQLENDYPAVTFVYMTGHLDGEGPTGALYTNNNRIRSFCMTNGKVLFDFADVESYDPANVYYPYGSDACEWCYDWCSTRTCPGCTECAHSHCFNCYIKGKAFWWLMARLAGWNPAAVGIVTDLSWIRVPEGATAQFRVRLSNIPAANVTVSAARVSGDSDLSVQSGAALTFTPANWNVYQAVTLAAAEDIDDVHGSATIRLSAPSLANKEITAQEIDKDRPMARYVPLLILLLD